MTRRDESAEAVERASRAIVLLRETTTGLATAAEKIPQTLPGGEELRLTLAASVLKIRLAEKLLAPWMKE